MLKLNRKIAVSESGFVFDSSTGDSFSVNPIGIEILELLKAGKTEKEIKNTLLEEYEVSPAVLEKSISDFIQSLKSLNVLQDE